VSLRVEQRANGATSANGKAPTGTAPTGTAPTNGAATARVALDRLTVEGAFPAAEILARVGAERGVPADLLEGFVDVLAAAAATGRQPRRAELDLRGAAGMRAAEREIPQSALVDAHLRVAELAWDELARPADGSSPVRLRAVGGSILAAAGRLVMAVSEGYERAEGLAVRREEGARREFIHDLLSGHTELGQLAQRAERFGLRLAGAHVVAVARAAEALTEVDPVTHRIEDALVARFGSHNVLVTTKDGLLVCLASSSLAEATGEFTSQVQTALEPSGTWQVGVGRAHPGPGGIVRSYEEACGTIELADRLRLRTHVLEASRLLVFAVLLRDRAAITDLVHSVLGPLQAARGGPEPLLDTLDAYFTAHGNATATARQLAVSVRTVGYRLDRIRQLTGHSPDDPTQRFALETAVLGARLLDWPAQPLQPTP
jgi:hypothetical protein